MFKNILHATQNSYGTLHRKLKSKWIIDLNTGTKIIKISRKNTILVTLGLQIFLKYITRTTKAKINIFNFTEMKRHEN